MDEIIETDKFYLSNPFFVPKSPSSELKIASEDVRLEDIKSENTGIFKSEPKTSTGTGPSVIIDPLLKDNFKGILLIHSRSNFYLILKHSNAINVTGYFNTKVACQSIRIVFKYYIRPSNLDV